MKKRKKRKSSTKFGLRKKKFNYFNLLMLFLVTIFLLLGLMIYLTIR